MPNKPRYICPVCGFPDLDEPPYDESKCASFDICPSCGTEYGYHDATRSHSELRREWVRNGMRWWSQSRKPSKGWDPELQLRQLKTPAE
jgi:predicted RNA-binding Zn-ribbon protein involved in translation (DUF1610 family)